MEPWSQALILKISTRAVKIAYENGNNRVKLIDVMMALSFVHDQSPIRLNELLEAKDADLAHDVFGILQHIDTSTGELDLARFCPRYLVPRDREA